MDDYISREAAITVIYNQHVGGKESCENARPNTYGADLREIVADIEDIPAADVRPVVRSRWKYIEYYPEGHDYKCQKCRYKNAEPTNYCPSCGAVMMGVDT